MSEKLIQILLVEDDEVDIMNIKRAFKKNHVSNPLFVCNNGIEAINFLRHEQGPAHIGIILLDLNMPRMGGIEFLQEMRKDEKLKHLAVFVMTNSDEDKDKIDAINLNVAGYILKPMSMDRFFEAVSALNNFWKLIEFPGS